MTLVVAVTSPESIWLLADRRLSGGGRVVRDDARKIMFLETTDGVAILGYAGLGATARGTEPADWMSAVLRGRNLPLERSLGVLCDAMRDQLPRHLNIFPKGIAAPHNVIVPAFLGSEPRLYTIDIVLAPDRKTYRYRYTRHQAESPTGGPRTPRIGIGGSGALYLANDRSWLRGVLRLVKANDRGKIRASAVAAHLAKLNHDVHVAMPDRSVGPRCIVAWRHRKGGFHKGGGGHEFYTGTRKDANSPGLPTIANGMDVHALTEAMMPFFQKQLEAMRAGDLNSEFDKDEVNATLARLPDKPDERLR